MKPNKVDKALTEKVLTYVTKADKKAIAKKIGTQRESEYFRNLIRADLKGG